MASPRSSMETVTPHAQNSPSGSPSRSPSNSNETVWLKSNPQGSKGKERAVDDLQADPFVNDEDQDDEEDPPTPTTADALTYPPPNDDDTDARRVEENLRRWEVAERQRRKQARTSVQSNSSSVLGELSHRASLLLRRNQRQSATHRSSFGTHVALHSSENINAATLREINASPTPSPSHSPSSTPARNSQNYDTNSHEMDITTKSPFSDPGASSDTLNVPPSLSRSGGSELRNPPTPRALDLPSPRTPPTIVNGQPRPMSSPSPTSLDRAPDPPKEVRWWHDWLCGCSEGPDRGGDYQSGRTNPME